MIVREKSGCRREAHLCSVGVPGLCRWCNRHSALPDVLICVGAVSVLIRTLPHMNPPLQASFSHTPQVSQVSHARPLILALLAVLMFAMTLPMTRLANGSVAEPQLPPLFVASARAALAGGLALLHLLWVRAAWPARAHGPWLAAIVLGGVMAFPLGMGWAVRIVPASHAAVIIGLLPLCTAALAAWWLGHRPRLGFWLSSVAGAVLMAVFAVTASKQHPLGGGTSLVADGALLLGMLGSSVAYVAGARLSREMPSSHVMSWSLLMAWPVTIALAVCWWPEHIHSLAQARAQIHPSAWAGLAYVAVCSTWLGFFFWYAALAQDAMRASQVQLLQPIVAMVFSALLLGEAVPARAWGFAVAVLSVVFIGQRMARASSSSSSLPLSSPSQGLKSSAAFVPPLGPTPRASPT